MTEACQAVGWPGAFAFASFMALLAFTLFLYSRSQS